MMFSFRLLFIALIGLVAIVPMFLILGRKENVPTVSKTIQSEVSDISPNPTMFQTTNETNEVHSPDGEMKLIMEKVTTGNSSTYSFSVANIAGGERKTVFSKILPKGSTMQLSPNSWSPDNKYFFIIEDTSGLMNYFIFSAAGEAFSDGEQYINVKPLFVAKNTGHNLSDITGWDSPTLLHVYTTTEEGSRGPSFWFEVPSKAIIQLASR